MDWAIVGIDISKATFDAALVQVDGWHSHKFKNTHHGFEELQAWLARLKIARVHACMEATSTYYLALATFLYEQGYGVSVVNPAQIKSFGESELRRTKTDRVDAAIIARFCRAMDPRLWTPPPPDEALLQALTRRLEALKDMRTQEMNRLQVPGTPESILASIQAMLEAINEQIARLERQLHNHQDQHPNIKAQVELLTSIPGIGEYTATKLLAEIGNISQYENADQLSAQAGLVPSEKRSGTSVRGKAHLSKKGRPRLRKALYWPAISAIRCNPLIAQFAQRQLDKGKPMMLIIAAAMRRLLHLAFGALKSQKPFAPNYVPQRP